MLHIQLNPLCSSLILCFLDINTRDYLNSSIRNIYIINILSLGKIVLCDFRDADLVLINKKALVSQGNYLRLSFKTSWKSRIL